MQIIKKNKITNKNRPTNSYKVTVIFDVHSSSKEVKEHDIIEENDPDLERFLTCLEKCTALYSHYRKGSIGRGGSDTYDDVQDYHRYFSTDDDSEDEPCAYIDAPVDNWGRTGTIINYNIVHYDEYGQKSRCEIEW